MNIESVKIIGWENSKDFSGLKGLKFGVQSSECGGRNLEDVYGQDCSDVTSATEDGFCRGERRMKYWDNLVVH